MRCTLCGKTRRHHCDLDEPGVDHEPNCQKMHHTFSAPSPAAASGVPLEERDSAIQYALGLMQNALDVASEYHRPFIVRHMFALDSLRSASSLPSEDHR